MTARAVPWLLWVREGIDDALLDAGRRAGLVDAGGPPAMGLPEIPTIPPPPDGLRIEIVDDHAGLETFRDLGARGFEMPREIIDVAVTGRRSPGRPSSRAPGSVATTRSCRPPNSAHPCIDRWDIATSASTCSSKDRPADRPSPSTSSRGGGRAGSFRPSPQRRHGATVES